MDLAAHPNATSRTAAAAPAYRGMRDASEAARLEHAGAGCYLDNPTVRIADAHEAVATLPDPTGDARQKYRPNDAGENQLSSAVIVSRVLWVSGDGRVIRSWIQFGSAARAVTFRPASIAPSSDRTGTSTATTRAVGCRRAYQGRTFSQKCRPIIA